MQPNRLGRVLGVSTRIAAEKIREKSAQMDAAATTAPRPQAPHPAPRSRQVTQATAKCAEGGRKLARGAGRFSAAMWRPFAHTTGVLSLQITGVFFAIFALYFISHSWHLYEAARWRDRHIIVYAVFALLFVWFALSSFWRAHRKQKR
jgi:hypothetical protein